MSSSTSFKGHGQTRCHSVFHCLCRSGIMTMLGRDGMDEMGTGWRKADEADRPTTHISRRLTFTLHVDKSTPKIPGVEAACHLLLLVRLHAKNAEYPMLCAWRCIAPFDCHRLGGFVHIDIYLHTTRRRHRTLAFASRNLLTRHKNPLAYLPSSSPKSNTLPHSILVSVSDQRRQLALRATARSCLLSASTPSPKTYHSFLPRPPKATRRF